MNDKIYKSLSAIVYEVDKLKKDPPYTKGDRLFNGIYEIIDSSDDINNGMQAMAVAPIINGEVDTSQIVIAYAGTNSGDLKDLKTDVHSIGLGNTSVMLKGSINFPSSLKIVDTQPKTALAFAEKIRKKYRNSKITTTGHSLGEALAMYVALKNGWNNTGFNGPDIFNMISKEEIEYMKANPKQFRNFRNWYDGVGSIVGNSTNSAIYLYYEWGIYTHSLSDWKTNEVGQIVYANGKVADPTLSDQIDINADGKIDSHLNGIDRQPRNLLIQEDYITSSKAIVVNTEILNTLSDNLRARIHEDVAQMAKICQLCIEKNRKINKDFELRKQEVSESIKEVFKSVGFPSLIYDVNNSVDMIIQQQSLLERSMEYTELRNPFLSHQTPMVNGDTLNTIMYNTQLATLRRACELLVTQIKQEKTYTISNFFMGEQTLLESWQIIESATKHLLQKSDELFEGEGLRLGKKDGISESLVIVLEIIHKNTVELLESLLSATELIQGIALHFEQADEWLGLQLKNGQFVGEIPMPSVPVDYKSYLERDHIFDDVKDVLQAFDQQVEQKSRQYARYVANVYHDTLGQFEKGLECWHSLAMELSKAISLITINYSQSVFIKEETLTQKQVGTEWIREVSYPVSYWGRLEQLYPAQTLEVISQLKHNIVSKIDNIQHAILKSKSVKGQLQHLEFALKPIIEEGVYRAFDLDDIVKGQQIILQFAKRLTQEIGHVAQVIVGEGMASQSIEMLQQQLQDTRRLIDYYAQFISDCFGDNEYTPVSVIASDSLRFSLNSPSSY